MTEAGATLLVSVQQALTLLETACRNVRVAVRSKRRHSLNLSVNPSLAALWLAPRIGRFIELHPDIDVQVFLHASQDPAWKARTSTWPSCTCASTARTCRSPATSG